MTLRTFVTRTMILLLVIGLVGLPAYAQQPETETTYATVAALEQTIIPSRDRVDLARRIYGVGDIPAPPASAPVWQIGDRQMFWVTNSTENRTFQVSATLRAVGDTIYLWVEDSAQMNDQDLRALAKRFDTRIYPAVRELWGSENSPGIDGDPRIYGLFAYGLGGGVAAYFTSEHTNPVEVVSTSNEHEMFFFNLSAIGTQINNPDIESTLAHEFQHMIRANVDSNEDTWMDEGFSMFTERYLGYENPIWSALSFLGAPYTQLNNWSEEGPRAPNYGAAFMFVTYFYERYGGDAIRSLSADPANGFNAVENVLRSLGEPGMDDLFADWVLANFLLDPTLADGRYGYELLWPGLPGPAPLATITDDTFETSVIANQYSADYYVFDKVGGKTALDVQISAPETVQLVPAEPFSGRWMWYSNKGDDSDMTLTRAFDLTGVKTATLSYRLWYHTERLWDYGYVMISADGGQTWTPLETPNTTTANPHNNAYGPGYTGTSGGWIKEVLPLDTYTGREILLRFEIITDDAVTQPGMVVDDVSIPEINYFEDFEVDDGSWQAEGWLRTDNLLPQNVWVQAVQRIGNDITVTRWLAPAENRWTLPLEDGADQVILAVSPFAPVTLVPMPYTLAVTVR